MKAESEPLDLIWGIESIANTIGRTVRQTHHMLSKGALPARRINGRWVVERSKLVALFMEPAE